MEVFLIVAVVGLLIAFAVFGAWAAKERREALAALALRLGLRYRAEKDYGLADRFGFLDALARGTNRYAYNLLSGLYQGHEVLVFDFHYETHSTDSKGRRQTHHHHFSFFILLLPQHFPELRISREGWLDKIAQAIGFEDIDFESAEFSRTFSVRSKNKKFAYDVCHVQMMEYLLAQRDLNLEIEGRALALAFGKCLAATELEPNLRRLLEIRTRLPAYLFTKL